MYINCDTTPLVGDRIIHRPDLKQAYFGLKRVLSVSQVLSGDGSLVSVITHLDERGRRCVGMAANAYLVRRRRRRHNPILTDTETYRNFNTTLKEGDVVCSTYNMPYRSNDLKVRCEVITKEYIEDDLSVDMFSQRPRIEPYKLYLIKRGDKKLELHPRRSHRHNLVR